MTYSEKLRDPRWQKKRLKIMERDDWKCRECFCSTKTLNVHHKFYLRGKAPFEYPDNMLETLCEDCHENREKATEALHLALIHATTGDLLVWAKRIKNERADLKRRLTKQANKAKAAAPSPIRPVVIPTDGKTIWNRMRDAANGLVDMEGLRDA